MAQEKTFTAELTGVGSAPIEITSIGIAFQRDTGPDGRPTSMVYGGTLSLSAIITEKTALAENMINKSNKPLATGKIEITTALKEGIYRTIEFTNGYITSYSENFDMTGGSVMSCAFTISAEKIKVGDIELDQKWPVAS